MSDKDYYSFDEVLSDLRMEEREIDALGGAMALAADRAGIQFRVLNRSKGPAVRATRAQADRALYRRAIRGMVEAQPNLHLFQQAVDDLVVEHGRVRGVVTQMGLTFRARAVVLTTGTFLGGVIHIGEQQYLGLIRDCALRRIFFAWSVSFCLVNITPIKNKSCAYSIPVLSIAEGMPGTRSITSRIFSGT